MEQEAYWIGYDLFEAMGRQETRETGAKVNGDDPKSERWAASVAALWSKYLKAEKGADFELTSQDVIWMVESLPRQGF